MAELPNQYRTFLHDAVRPGVAAKPGRCFTSAAAAAVGEIERHVSSESGHRCFLDRMLRRRRPVTVARVSTDSLRARSATLPAVGRQKRVI